MTTALRLVSNHFPNTQTGKHLLGGHLRMMANLGNIIILSADNEDERALKLLETVLDLIKDMRKKQMRILYAQPDKALARQHGLIASNGVRVRDAVDRSLTWAMKNDIQFESITPYPVSPVYEQDPWSAEDVIGDVYHGWHRAAFGLMRVRDLLPESRLVLVANGWTGSNNGIKWSLDYKQQPEQKRIVAGAIRNGATHLYLPRSKSITATTVFVGDQPPLSTTRGIAAQFDCWLPVTPHVGTDWR